MLLVGKLFLCFVYLVFGVEFAQVVFLGLTDYLLLLRGKTFIFSLFITHLELTFVSSFV